MLARKKVRTITSNTIEELALLACQQYVKPTKDESIGDFTVRLYDEFTSCYEILCAKANKPVEKPATDIKDIVFEQEKLDPDAIMA